MKKATTPRKARREVLSLQEWRRRHLPGTPHKVLWNSAVTEYVDAELLNGTPYNAVVEQCRVRFGRAVAPSKSALGRYWNDVLSRRAR